MMPDNGAKQATGLDPRAFRDRFPILARTTYLISNSLGAVPAATRDDMNDYVQTWAERGVRAWEETWWDMAAQLGDGVAPLVGARPGQIVAQPNVTLAHAVIFSCFDFRSGRPRVVTDSMHFPSILYLLEQQRHLGADLVVVESADGIGVETELVLNAIDERTAFVNISHVLFKTAYIHDVAAIAAKARSVGALTIVDGYQAVGTIPVDVFDLGVDVYIGGCLKWLCGGPGVAFMWVHPDAVTSLDPRLTGWMSHVRPFDFAPELERRDDAWRFLHGTPNIPAFYAARAGLAVVAEAGAGPIRAHSMRQTRLLMKMAGDRGWRCRAPAAAERRGGTVAFDVENGYEVSLALKSRGILCDYRPGAGIRLSPHFYTLDEELSLAIAAIAETLETGAWRAHAGHRASVT